MQHSPTSAVLLVPVKAFGQAKARLAAALAPRERADLARAMAGVVLDAAAPLGPVVVCEDDDVAAWARERGAAVAWTPGHDLNGALSVAASRARDAGISRLVIAHADLPFATGLADFADADPDEVLIVADRHGEGTNVMSIPTAPMLEFRYGTGSLGAHREAASAVGLRVVEVAHPALAWDVDEPADLEPPASLGPMPAIAPA